jgi:hypothetical protein
MFHARITCNKCNNKGHDANPCLASYCDVCKEYDPGHQCSKCPSRPSKNSRFKRGKKNSSPGDDYLPPKKKKKTVKFKDEKTVSALKAKDDYDVSSEDESEDEDEAQMDAEVEDKRRGKKVRAMAKPNIHRTYRDPFDTVFDDNRITAVQGNRWTNVKKVSRST